MVSSADESGRDSQVIIGIRPAFHAATTRSRGKGESKPEKKPVMSACRCRLASRESNSSVVPTDMPKCWPLARMSAFGGAVGRTGPAGGAGAASGGAAGSWTTIVLGPAAVRSCSQASPLWLPSIAASSVRCAVNAACAASWVG